jgi:hypothetical protein
MVIWCGRCKQSFSSWEDWMRHACKIVDVEAGSNSERRPPDER